MFRINKQYELGGNRVVKVFVSIKSYLLYSTILVTRLYALLTLTIQNLCNGYGGNKTNSRPPQKKKLIFFIECVHMSFNLNHNQVHTIITIIFKLTSNVVLDFTAFLHTTFISNLLNHNSKTSCRTVLNTYRLVSISLA